MFTFGPPSSGSFSMGTSATSAPVDTGALVFDVLSTFENKEAAENYTNGLNRFVESKRIPSSQIIPRLKHAHNSGDLCLVLGAGVSMSHGLPDWETLLQKLLINVLDAPNQASKHKVDLLSKLFIKVISPDSLVLARFLNYIIESPTDQPTRANLPEMVKEALYEKWKLEGKTEVLSEICMLWKNYQRLNSVVTYNFDDILEKKLTEVGLKFSTKQGKGEVIGQDGLKIFHVHGYVPQNAPVKNLESIVFSEDRYHEQYRDYYNWQNLVQVNKFNECTSLFIGLSFSDPNLRRLLDLSWKYRSQSDRPHFVIKVRPKSEKIKKDLVGYLDSDQKAKIEKLNSGFSLEDVIKILANASTYFEEADALSLGINTIWVNDYPDIPVKIKEINAAAGE